MQKFSLQKFTPSTPSLHRYAFGAVLASASILSHFNVLAFSTTTANKSDIKMQFMELDTNHDHQLSHDESSRDWDVNPKFNKADFNGDGVLELKEYVNFKTALHISSGPHERNIPANALVVNGIVVKGY